MPTYEGGCHCGRVRFAVTADVDRVIDVPRSDPDKVDVNARCLRGVDVASLTIVAFDGRNWEQAIDRS